MDAVMRICNNPKVYLVAKTMIDINGLNKFLTDQKLSWPTEHFFQSENSRGHPSQAEQLVELAGRVCYMSFGGKAGSKTNKSYIDNLLGRLPGGGFKEGPAHGSVLEHSCFSFIVAGAGRGFSHEQVRHRAGWAYSQLSTRYCDFEREETTDGTWEPGFTIPNLGKLSKATRDAIEDTHRRALSDYKHILGLIESDIQQNAAFVDELSKHSEKERKRMLRKAARGAARDVLPNGTEAIMVMTANVRAIWNTIHLRASEHAEGEIRSVYVQIANIMEHEMPSVFCGMKRKKLWDGSEAIELPRDKL
jgi:thymidylate synthase (FAD)